MDRRGFLTTLLGSIPFIGSIAFALPKRIEMRDIKKESDIAVVYHCDFPQEPRFKAMLTNIRNHLSVYNFDPFKIKIVVVAHGPGVKFFMKDLYGSPWENEPINIKELYQMEKDLTISGVEYYICNITLTRLRLDSNKLHEFTAIVPSGVGALGELQAKGFGYIKVQ